MYELLIPEKNKTHDDDYFQLQQQLCILKKRDKTVVQKLEIVVVWDPPAINHVVRAKDCSHVKKFG